MKQPAPHADRCTMYLATLSLTVLLCSCSRSPQEGSAASTGGDAASQSQPVLGRYLAKHGQALDQCFGPPPAIRGPGAIATVADAAPKLAPVSRLVLTIDASGSMAARSGGETKMEAAKRAAVAFLRGRPADTQVGLVVFGHRGTNLQSGKAESCRGVETLYPLGAADPAQVETALGQVRSAGWTPLAAAIATAGRSFAPGLTRGAQVVYVVSDGLETCGGDPVAAARALSQGPVKAIVNVIGFDLGATDRAQLAAVASAGGGEFVEAKSGGDVSRALDGLWRKVRANSAITSEYYDAAHRSTDNNIAVGRYTSDLNFCFARTTSAETTGLQGALDAAGVVGPDREAARVTLARRHQSYHDRVMKVAADLLAQAKAANGAILAQQRSSETRLGLKP